MVSIHGPLGYGDDGYNVIMEKLKLVFAKDNEQKAFEECRKFEVFKRPSEMNIGEYITEFERLYDMVQVHDMKYADGVLAYKLLINANISEEKQSMCRATMGKLTFENIKKQLKVIHDSTGTEIETGAHSNVTVKEEQVFEAEYGYHDNFYAHARDSWRGNRGSRGNSRGNFRGGYRGNSNRKFVSNSNTEQEMHRQKESGFSMKKKNPVDRYGRVTKCSICESIFHWVRDCPERGTEKEDQISLFSNEIQKTYLPQFLQETINCAILDCGCVKSVCGKTWFNIYTDSLTKAERESISETSGSARFRFGVGGPVFVSERKVTFPAIIGSRKVSIEADIIECDLPLLLSKESMKKADTQINFKEDEVTMLGQKLKLHFTTSGHYSVPLGCATSEEEKVEETFLKIEELDRESKRKACRKLHIQFGHARSSRLLNLLKDANVEDKETSDLIKEVEEKCETCTKFKKPKLRPVVGFGLAKDFNDMVSMDLKFHKTTPWLHMIDHSTRFSAACVIPDKKQETVIEKVFKHWIVIFGSPKKILSDNGCEFNNQAMRELGELLNVEVKTTAAESPWSNGITERHNGLIGSMLDKIIDDRKCSLELALSWAVYAKNTLSNVYGYSPYQLVFGKNPNIPGVLTDELPALESVTSSKILADHLDAITAARRGFVEAEASSKVKRALARKIRPATSLIYETGDKVFYKRNDSDKWRGPATVIGKEKHQVFVKHGGIYVRVNPCHLTHVKDDVMLANAKRDTKYRKEEVHRDEIAIQNEDDDSDDSERVTETENQEEGRHGNVNDGSEEEEKDDQEMGHQDNESNESEEEDDERHEIDGSTQPEKIQSTAQIPHKGVKIQYKMKGSDTTEEARVLGKAGKATGKNKLWINIEDKDGHLKSLNLEQVTDMQKIDDVVLLSTRETTHDVEVKQAMTVELENWRHHSVFAEVEDKGQSAISSRWVITEKYKEGEKFVKARLVARGFEEDQINDIRKDSPTCGKDSLRLSLTLFASMDWQIHSLDVKSAFLQGNAIEREVYIIPPREVNTNKLWKLNKTVYGLADASRTWYLRVRGELLKLGVQVSKYDEAIFFWIVDEKLEGLLCCHVDDFLWGGSESFKRRIIDKIKDTFETSREETESLKYLGLDLKQISGAIVVSQKKYIDGLEFISGDQMTDNNDELNKKGKRLLRGAVGQLNWIAFQTRPDIAFDACNTAVSLKNAIMKDIQVANKGIKKAKASEVAIQFRNIGDIREAHIVCFCDASFRNLKGESSQGAHVIFLKGKRNFSPVTWQSKKIRRIVKSTLAAEALALDDAADSCFYLKTLLQEVTGSSKECFPITLKTDSRNLHDAVYSTKTLEDRRLKIDICSLRQKLSTGEIHKIEWIRKEFQLADCLTKNEAPTSNLIGVLHGNMQI